MDHAADEMARFLLLAGEAQMSEAPLGEAQVGEAHMGEVQAVEVLMTGAGPSDAALEVKTAGAAPEVEFARLLADFTAEMRAQFDLFRRLRESAEALLHGADEGQAKLARADIKAATDAIALIIRTLEKIDALSRQLERDRAEAEERRLEESDPDRLRQSVSALIEAQVEARLEERLEERLEAAVAVRLKAGQAGQGP